jgi:hypothetical protein
MFASLSRAVERSPAVTLTKIGTARNGSSTAVSVTMKRRYSCQADTGRS